METANQFQQEKKSNFFDACMRQAGYKTYKDLANDIILSLPDGIDLSDTESVKIARRNIATTIGQLASGKTSPIFYDKERDGLPRPIALEVATLLQIDFDDLFAVQLPTQNVVSESDLVEVENMMASPDLLLTQRDLVAMAGRLDPKDLETFVKLELEGLTIEELATLRNMRHVPSSINAIRKELDRATLILSRTTDRERATSFYSPLLLNDFDAVRAAVDLSFESKRIYHLLQCDGITKESKDKILRDFIRELRHTEQQLVSLGIDGYTLKQCDGYQITQMFEVYAEHKLDPSRDFLNASVASRNVISNDPLKYGYLSRLRAALQTLYHLPQHRYRDQSDYSNLLEIR